MVRGDEKNITQVNNCYVECDITLTSTTDDCWYTVAGGVVGHSVARDTKLQVDKCLYYGKIIIEQTSKGKDDIIAVGGIVGAAVGDVVLNNDFSLASELSISNCVTVFKEGCSATNKFDKLKVIAAICPGRVRYKHILFNGTGHLDSEYTNISNSNYNCDDKNFCTEGVKKEPSSDAGGGRGGDDAYFEVNQSCVGNGVWNAIKKTKKELGFGEN